MGSFTLEWWGLDWVVVSAFLSFLVLNLAIIRCRIAGKERRYLLQQLRHSDPLPLLWTQSSGHSAAAMEIGWSPLVRDLCRVNEAWIREFYANSLRLAYSRDELVAYIGGIQIILTPAAIIEALGMPNPPENELKARDMDGNRQWLVDILVVEKQRGSVNLY
ncbi:hypothetical protein HAX54_039548 [Datura stramonium]|uniref:Uncharacterized protein n=1 Tax=Datura stramonium TaxID=4076 RepID=A0ABS8RNE8_DATST|nr:hypothetical protein [Datura stramonium]